MKSGAWRRHPAVRTGDELSFGERAADIMRNAFGSWSFVFGFLTFMAVWMVVNSILLRNFGHKGFDPYPYILLNLCLSMMAGLQGALILIAAKRADRVSAEAAIHHYEETKRIDTLLEENTQLTRALVAALEENTTLTRTIHTQTCLLEEIHRHVSGQPGEFSP